MFIVSALEVLLVHMALYKLSIIIIIIIIIVIISDSLLKFLSQTEHLHNYFCKVGIVR